MSKTRGFTRDRQTMKMMCDGCGQLIRDNALALASHRKSAKCATNTEVRARDRAEKMKGGAS